MKIKIIDNSSEAAMSVFKYTKIQKTHGLYCPTNRSDTEVSVPKNVGGLGT